MFKRIKFHYSKKAKELYPSINIEEETEFNKRKTDYTKSKNKTKII